VGESTVREYVNLRKQALGLLCHEVFVPQSVPVWRRGAGGLVRDPGSVDGQPRKVYIFCMRSMASGAAFHRAYPHATQQAFLEAHELAFAWFGGVFRTLRFDNLSSAVKKILRGHQREETTRFIAFARTGLSGGVLHAGRRSREGCVEARADIPAQPFLSPYGGARSGGTDRLLESGLLEEQNRIIAGRGCRSVHRCCEREHLLPLAAEGFDLAACISPGQPERLRKGADQLLLDAAAGGHGCRSQGLLGLCRDLARRTVRGAA